MKRLIARFKQKILRNIKNYKFHSIFIKSLLLEILLSMIPFLIMSALYYSNVQQTENNRVMTENRFVLQEISDITDTILNECDLLPAYIAKDDNVQMFMVNDWFIDMEKASLGQIDQLMRSFPIIYRYIDSIYIFSEYNRQVSNGESWSSVDSFRDCGWLSAYYETEQQRGITIARKKNDNYPYLISVIKPVFMDQEKKGAVILNINSTRLYKTVSSANYENIPNIYLTDNRGNVLISGENQDFSKNMRELYPSYQLGTDGIIETCNAAGEKFMVSGTPSSMFGMQYVIASPTRVYTERMARMRTQIILIFCLIMLLCLIFAFIVSVVIYKPLGEIIDMLENPDEVDLKQIKQNKLQYIMSNILHHIKTNHEMKQELEERFRLLNKSQIGMLQSQINPHFLYNTLETINWMAVDLTGGDNSVSAAITSLSRLLRNTINENDYIVGIDEEIEYTNHYLDILKLRYADMFRVEWKLPEKINRYVIVKICLQPLIENAVYHGLKPKGEDGLLQISGRVGENYIQFEIRDNGVGMDAETVRMINQNLKAEDYVHEGHIGIYNVNYRIRIIFGNQYGVQVNSRPNEGTSVKIRIPKIAKE